MVRFRQAVAADEAAIRGCAARAFAPYVAAIGRRPAPMDEDYAALIAAGHVRVVAGEAVLGFVVFFPEVGAMRLHVVAVDPGVAGTGLGRALVGLCEDAAREAGSGVVRLVTNLAMTANLSIYPRLGYVETGRMREDGFDRVVFEKRLE